MRTSRFAAAAALILGSLVATPALSQEKGRFAIGANVGFRAPGDSSAASGDRGIGVLWRFGQSHQGWGWHYGLNWYATDVDWRVGGRNAELGRLGVKPIMGGYGYTHVMGRTSISGSLVGGYAFTSLNQHGDFASTVNDRLNATSVAIDAANTFVVRPGVSAWYNVSDKIGINLSANYLAARPKISVISSAGSDVQRLNADMFSVKIGAVYSLF